MSRLQTVCPESHGAMLEYGDISILVIYSTQEV